MVQKNQHSQVSVNFHHKMHSALIQEIRTTPLSLPHLHSSEMHLQKHPHQYWLHFPSRSADSCRAVTLPAAWNFPLLSWSVPSTAAPASLPPVPQILTLPPSPVPYKKPWLWRAAAPANPYRPLQPVLQKTASDRPPYSDIQEYDLPALSDPAGHSLLHNQDNR